MGWIYDLNFPRAFQIVRETGYLEWIRDAISFKSSCTSDVYTGPLPFKPVLSPK